MANAGDYYVKIGFRSDKKTLKKMEDELNGRFQKVSKNFGRRVYSSIKGVIATGIIANMFAPFDKVNQDLNSILDKYKTLAVNADNFGVNRGEYFKLSTIAESKGVSNENLNSAFQTFISRLNKARTGEDNTLKNFTGAENNLQAFGQFIETLRQMDATGREQAITEILGSSKNVKLAEFLTSDLQKEEKNIFGNTTTKQIEEALTKVVEAGAIQDRLGAKREVDNLLERQGIINGDLMKKQDEAMRKMDKNLNDQLKQYESLVKQEKILLDIKNEVQKIGTNILNNGASTVEETVTFAKGLREDPTLGLKMWKMQFDAMGTIFKSLFGGK